MRKAKLTKEDIKEILNLYFNRGALQTEIAKKLGTNQVAVTWIIGYYRSTKGGGKNCPKAYKAFIDEIKKDRLEKVAANAKISVNMKEVSPIKWKEATAGSFDGRIVERGLGDFLDMDERGHFDFKGKTPHKCPVCDGRGFVPGGFYGTTTGNWSTVSTATETCRSCVNGIIWG